MIVLIAKGMQGPFPSPSLFLRSVLFVVYAPAEVTMFLSADISRNRLGASLGQHDSNRAKPDALNDRTADLLSSTKPKQGLSPSILFKS